VSGFRCLEVPESDILIFFSYVSTLNYLKILLDIFSSATWTPGLRTAFFSVIPGLTRNPCLSERDGGRLSGRAEIFPVTFSRSTWTPGLRPAFFSVIPGLTRNPCSSERDGGRVTGSGEIPPVTFSRSTWTPDQVRGDGLLKDPGFFRPFSVIPGLTRACPGLDPGESIFIGTRRRKPLRK
jgi:hypothetical protein